MKRKSIKPKTDGNCTAHLFPFWIFTTSIASRPGLTSLSPRICYFDRLRSADYQDGVDVDVYEGERGVTDGNNKLGHFLISGIERAKRGVPQVEVTFDIDANGILNVSALDTVTKARGSVTITNSIGHLSSEQIDAMVMEAERLKADDDARLARIEARNELETLVYHAREIAAARDHEKLKNLAESVQTWLDAADLATTPPSKFKTRAAEIEKEMSKAQAAPAV